MKTTFLPICKFNDRFFTVVTGLPFYLSTGRNSGKQGCWFPCFGMREASESERGRIIKPSRSSMYREIELDETLYYVNPNVAIENITWQEFPRSEKQSILLLQWCNNVLRARYLSSKNMEMSFIVATNLPIDLITSQILHVLFNEKRAISAKQLKQQVRKDYPNLKEAIDSFINNLFSLFYQHTFRDTRLNELQHFDYENCRFAERFITFPLFCLSEKLHQRTPEQYKENETSSFWSSMQVKQLLAKQPLLPLSQSLTMDKYETFHNESQVNQWLRANNAIVLPNCDPLDVFIKLRAASFWVSQQKILGESSSRTMSVLDSMGVRLELTVEQMLLNLFWQKKNTITENTPTNDDENLHPITQGMHI